MSNKNKLGIVEKIIFNKQLDNYYNEDNETQREIIKEQLHKRFGVDKKCKKCRDKLLKSDIADYSYLCLSCDENFYSFEID